MPAENEQRAPTPHGIWGRPMSNEYDYDLLVLGGGMAGLPVAMKCAYSGMETALVEENLLGGTCLNRGCIPT